MRNTQSEIAINIVLIQEKEKSKTDPYFFSRMGLNPSLHKQYYPLIPIILPAPQKERVVPTSFEYGEDPYENLREGFGEDVYNCMFK